MWKQLQLILNYYLSILLEGTRKNLITTAGWDMNFKSSNYQEWYSWSSGWLHCIVWRLEDRSSETMVPNHHTTWHQNPENHEFYLHCCENLKSHTTSSNHYSVTSALSFSPHLWSGCCATITSFLQCCFTALRTYCIICSQCSTMPINNRTLVNGNTHL